MSGILAGLLGLLWAVTAALVYALLRAAGWAEQHAPRPPWRRRAANRPAGYPCKGRDTFARLRPAQRVDDQHHPYRLPHHAQRPRPVTAAPRPDHRER